MKAAFILYENFSNLDFASIYGPLLNLKKSGLMDDLTLETCSGNPSAKSDQGVRFAPTKIGGSLDSFDLIILPGSSDPGTLPLEKNFLEWLKTAASAARIAAVGKGIVLLGAAGLIKGRNTAAMEADIPVLEEFGAFPQSDPIVLDGNIWTAAGSGAALELGIQLCENLVGPEAGQSIREQFGIPLLPFTLPGRQSKVIRKTKETEIELELNIDGTGKHEVDTGLPFLNHMLDQIAVHGMFDLRITAKGDIEIDPHHTMEDVGLALGQAFQEALGDRKGIVRMASHDWTMDESLAWAAVDFSGRPYAVIQTNWQSPSVGGLPISLFAHFLESFALQARCNLHVRSIYGRDDHHQAEAIFKALARALDAATQIDPRRAEQVPSSKGILF